MVIIMLSRNISAVSIYMCKWVANVKYCKSKLLVSILEEPKIQPKRSM